METTVYLITKYLGTPLFPEKSAPATQVYHMFFGQAFD